MLCGCTMRAFQLTEDKLIYFALENIDGKKKFSFYEITIAACLKSLSFQQIFLPKEKKKRYIVLLLFLFLTEGR